MPTAYKVLGQVYPSAATATTLYTVPSATSAVASTIVACNQTSGAADTFSIAIRPAGATLTDKHYLYKDISLGAGTTFTGTFGITLATTDVVTVVSANGTTSFNLFGSEIS